MRKFIFLLLIIGAGFFLYANRDTILGPYAFWLIPKIYDALPAQDSPIGPYAIRFIGHLGPNNEPAAEVDVISGTRWRIETTSGRMSKILVVVCDGSNISSNTIGRANADGNPGLEFNRVLAEGPRIAAEARLLNRELAVVDGHMCVKISHLGMTAWIDSTTGFPVYYSNPSRNIDGHCSRIPIDFTQPATEGYFNTRNTLPYFTKYLNQ